MGWTKRLTTHWVPTGPPVATTGRSRFTVMIRDTVQHTGGASPQLYGAPLRRIWRLGGALSVPRTCSARPAAISKHTTEQHARLKRRSTFRAKDCQASGIEAVRIEAGDGTHGRAQKCCDRACARVHHLRFESPAAVALTDAHAGSSRTATSA